MLFGASHDIVQESDCFVVPIETSTVTLWRLVHDVHALYGWHSDQVELEPYVQCLEPLASHERCWMAAAV
jgi:hypothetical protein